MIRMIKEKRKCHEDIKQARTRKREVNTILDEIEKSLPIVIGFVGFADAGKSLTANHLFGTDFSIDRPCDNKVELDCQTVRIHLGHHVASDFLIYDLSGLRADADDYLMAELSMRLEECDVIVWVANAEMPDVSDGLRHLANHKDKIIFALNKIDKVSPSDWNAYFGIPSEAQVEEIELIQQQWQTCLMGMGYPKLNIYTYSGLFGLGLPTLFEAVVRSVPSDKAWFIEAMKEVDLKTSFLEHFYD